MLLMPAAIRKTFLKVWNLNTDYVTKNQSLGCAYNTQSTSKKFRGFMCNTFTKLTKLFVKTGYRNSGGVAISMCAY